MAVVVGVAPYQLRRRELVEMELCFVGYPFADVKNNASGEVGGEGIVATHGGNVYQRHAETLGNACEIEILALGAPTAGTYIVENQQHRATILEGDGIILTGGVEGGAVVVEIHGACFVHIDVAFGDVVAPAVLVCVVAFHLHRQMLGAATRPRNKE